MQRFTIFGGRGFIGSHLAAVLADADFDVLVPARNADLTALGDMGNVIYCAGVTADFRNRPYDTMDAHVGYLAKVLQTERFDSLLYLSSTRIYDGATDGAEDGVVTVDSMSPSDLYNLSKLAGEALCLNADNPAIRVARVSNVYGPSMFADAPASANFLASVISDAAGQSPLVLDTSPASTKDYIEIGDVTRALVLIALGGSERVYNVASGENVTHEDIMDRLSALTGRGWSCSSEAPISSFPRIRTGRLAAEFLRTGVDWKPVRLLDQLAELVRAAKRYSKIREGAAA